MALDFDAVAIALAAAINSAQIVVNDLQVIGLDYTPESAPGVSGMWFAVGDFTNSYDQTFQSGGSGGKDRVTVTCRLFHPRTDEATAQRALRQAARNGSQASVVKALRGAQGAPGQPALSGAADDLHVQSMRGPRLIEIGAAEEYLYAFDFTVLVVG